MNGGGGLKALEVALRGPLHVAGLTDFRLAIEAIPSCLLLLHYFGNVMTLIVAGIDNNTIWMLGDSLLSGGDMSVRDREYAIKIERGGNCVVGFSGDAHLGQAAIRQAADLNDFRGSVDRLTTLSKNGGVDFAFGWHDGASRLVRIVGGIATEVTTLHLGSQGAFAKFQEIRNTYVAAPAPNAHKTLICGSNVGVPQVNVGVPQVVVTALVSLFDLFAERQERDVGGWVLGRVDKVSDP